MHASGWVLPLVIACLPAQAGAASPAPAAPVAPATQAAPGAQQANPAFPFMLVGRMRTPDGHDAIVLARGQGVYVATAGAVLDDAYRIESLTRDAIEVTDLRLKQRQTVLLSSLPAAPAAAPVSYAEPAFPVREMVITRDMDPAQVQALMSDPPPGVIFRVEAPEGAAPAIPVEAAAPPVYDPLNPPPTTVAVPREIELPSGARMRTAP